MSTVFICYLKILTFLLILCESCAAVEVVRPRNITKAGTWRYVIQQREAALQFLKHYVNITANEKLPECMQQDCKVLCMNSQAVHLDKSIDNAFIANRSNCSIVQELRLYNMEFPKQRITFGFLGEYYNKVRKLYIGASNVTTIAAGAFKRGIFEEINLENLQLEELNKNNFKNCTFVLTQISVIQRNKPIKLICDDLLGNIRYQIRSFTLQGNIKLITNTTASSSLLNNLKYLDLSYNNFTNTFTDETFEKLWVVEYLDLSHSNIQYLPNYIFSQITGSLTYLNLSYNQLTTINHLIFGRHAIYDDLIIDLNYNPWNCTCDLLTEMNTIMVYQSGHPTCHEPVEYEILSVLDERVCPGKLNETTNSTAIIKSTTKMTKKSTTLKPITTARDYDIDYITSITAPPKSPVIPPIKSPTILPTLTTTLSDVDDDDGDTILVRCLAPGETPSVAWHVVLWPETQLRLVQLPHLRVEVLLEITDSTDTYGLIWFSTVVDDYYSMTVNYNQYGLGCVGPVSYTTIVANLLPNTAYTFCLVANDKLTISPYHCDSLHMDSNLQVVYNTWLSHDMRATGISLTIFGVLMSCFLGIASVYMLLKRKPTLLKGSKRVKTTSTNSIDIVIFPKERSLENLKLKEETLAKRNSRSVFDTFNNSPIATNRNIIHRGSIVSVESNQSYMNANLYEVIPAYLRLQDIASDCEKKSLEFESIDSYMSTLAPKYECTSVSYAEVSPRNKRASNDPLPALPTNRMSSTPTLVLETPVPMSESMPYITVTDAHEHAESTDSET
ncbi:uncharacterized protein LOC114803644 isoform X2 [Zeugodacus cucurbitae]|uniref:uncharacterized protein LOC114803644 isoform X2 n=1 Tax=Zeugodacus cucurbitae TaxID=28588 RepID=UPI0023D8FA60|nr:uncharacterized protein LOC114803644 isoform X2 [Zeugodacus cucurbitae]